MAPEMNLRKSTLRPGMAALTTAALAAVCLMIGGCGDPVRNSVEHRIEDALPKLIGPAKSYEVKVYGSQMAMLKGRLRTTHIVGREVRFHSGITVEELVVESHGIEIDRHRQQISRVEGTSYKATIAQDVLNKHLRGNYRHVPSLKAVLAQGLITVSAAPELKGLPVQISADADLKVKDKRYLILDLKKISVGGIGTPGFAREYLETKINPVFDSASLGYDAKLDRVQIDSNRLTLEGTLDLASHLNVKKPEDGTPGVSKTVQMAAGRGL